MVHFISPAADRCCVWPMYPPHRCSPFVKRLASPTGKYVASIGSMCRRQASGKPVPGVGLAKRIALDVAKGLVFLHARKV